MTSVAALAPAWRPRPLAGGAALSVAVHALAIGALAWQAARMPTPPAAPAGPRITLLWLLREPAQRPGAAMPAVHLARDAPADVTPADSASRRTPPRRSGRSPEAASAGSRVAPQPRPPAPVEGIAFRVPSLRVAPGREAASDTRVPSELPALPAASAPPPGWLMQPARQAALAQIGLRLQQHLAALPAPGPDAEGRCTLAADDPAALRCDLPALQASVAADAPALASLLRAYRGLAPQLDHVALAYAQQRFRLDAR
jgi:hypothetical protein